MASDNLSKRQQQIYDFIIDFSKQHHVPPSMREIGSAVGLSSPSTVHMHLKVLEEKGYIKREGSKSRSIVVTNADETQEEAPSGAQVTAFKASKTVSVPLVGNVAAGSPILAEENVEETLEMPISLVGPNDSFMLKVRGTSMINAGINDGDTIIVRSQQTAHNGEIVVALIDNEATVKTYYKETDRIRLQPENPTMEPIYVREVQILGVVTGLFRSF